MSSRSPFLPHLAAEEALAFFNTTPFRIALSNIVSASSFFSLAFSSGSAFSFPAGFSGQMIHRIICWCASPSMRYIRLVYLKGCIRDAVLAADIGCLRARLLLLQYITLGYFPKP